VVSAVTCLVNRLDVGGYEYRGRVKTVAIAGGIGAGKSVLAERLTTLGWPVIDADVIARRVVEKGEPAWRALRDAFGTAAMDEDGELDRKFVADIVFHDPSALRRLNHITHGPSEKRLCANSTPLTAGRFCRVAALSK